MKVRPLAMFILALSQAIAIVLALIVAAMGFGELFTAQQRIVERDGIALLITGGAMMIVAIVLHVVALIAAFGLLGDKAWARSAGDVAAGLAALEFPLGTAFAVWWWKRGRLG